MDQIVREIARNDVVIVDITGGNPNVFFELGIARATKPERKVIIVRREGAEDDVRRGGAEDDRLPRSSGAVDNLVPFDVQSDRYLPFPATDEGIKTMLPLLEQRLWDALEKSQWFLIREREVYPVGRLETADRASIVDVEVQPTAFVERQMGPTSGRVHVTVTIGRARVSSAVNPEPPAPQPLTASLGYEETMALGSLPWRLKFHRFEDDKARFCLESTERA